MKDQGQSVEITQLHEWIDRILQRRVDDNYGIGNSIEAKEFKDRRAPKILRSAVWDQGRFWQTLATHWRLDDWQGGQ